MEFLRLPVAESVGCILTHTAGEGADLVRKGTVLTPQHLQKLTRQGYARIAVARLAQDDVLENDAADILAQRLQGAHVSLRPPFTGRVNLHADLPGLLVIDEEAIHRFNVCDESVTVATLAQFSPVAAGEMVATIKIIPFAISASLLAKVQAAVGSAISVKPFRPMRVAVVSTLLPHLKSATVTKTLRALEQRLNPSQSVIIDDVRVDHELSALAHALSALDATDYDLLIIFGASAVTDRRDVVPESIRSAGGQVHHVGMPVDPGNLLVLGTLHERPVIGAPGCARSPRENGFDWVLNRILADIPVSSHDIMRMGVGGLLKEITTRPQPRSGTDMA